MPTCEMKSELLNERTRQKEYQEWSRQMRKIKRDFFISYLLIEFNFSPLFQ